MRCFSRGERVRILHRQERTIITAKDFDLEKNWTLVVVMIGVETWKRFCRLCFGASMALGVRVAICGNRGKLCRTCRGLT
jgi:hypothetical protein